MRLIGLMAGIFSWSIVVGSDLISIGSVIFLIPIFRWRLIFWWTSGRIFVICFRLIYIL